MAVPKRKITKSKRNHKRQHIKVKHLNLVKCNNCDKMKENHRVCMHCGHYKDSQIVKVKKIQQKS